MSLLKNEHLKPTPAWFMHYDVLTFDWENGKSYCIKKQQKNQKKTRDKLITY